MIDSTHRWHLVRRFSAKKTVEPEQSATHMADVVTNFQPFNQVDLICGVPAQRGKDFHLPAELAARSSTRVGLPDITPDFSFAEDKPS